MAVTDELLKNAERYAEGFDKGGLPMPPTRRRCWAWPRATGTSSATPAAW